MTFARDNEPRQSGRISSLTSATTIGGLGGRPKLTISLVLISILALGVVFSTVAFFSPFGWIDIQASYRVLIAVMQIAFAAIVGAYAIFRIRHPDD